MADSWYPQVKAVFDAQGVPETIWWPILQAESGGDPSARNQNNEDSIGLFQLNRFGGQGNGYSVEQLLDPQQNAEIASEAIATAYRQFGDNIAEVARHSGHPGLVEPSDQRIQRIVQIQSEMQEPILMTDAPYVNLDQLTSWYNKFDKKWFIIGAIALGVIILNSRGE
jgi:hypothetical protein